MARIFLCHASEDKAQVRDVYRRLRAIDGFEPWLDEENLSPGEEWEREIPQALKTSDFILIFLSRNSVTKRGYFQWEMKLALDAWQELPEGTIHTIPVRIDDDCVVPEPFRRYHYANLFDSQGFERLIRAIHTGLTQRQHFTPELTLEPPPDPIQDIHPTEGRRRINIQTRSAECSQGTTITTQSLEMVYVVLGQIDIICTSSIEFSFYRLYRLESSITACP